MIGTERIVDYVAAGYTPKIGGVISLAKELSSHKEFNQKSMCVVILDPDDNLLKACWYTEGEHSFPKADLDLAIKDNVIVLVATGNDELTREEMMKRLNTMMPDTKLNYQMIDLLWANGNKVRSYLCKNMFCCPPEGSDITTSEDNDGKENKEE